MKIYLAACYDRRDEMIEYAKEIFETGNEVTSRWLIIDHSIERYELHNPIASPTGDRFASEDLEDIALSDCLVMFSEDPWNPPINGNRGGRHVELGYALGRDCIVALIGPRENIFHHYNKIEYYESWEQFIATLKGYTAKGASRIK